MENEQRRKSVAEKVVQGKGTLSVEKLMQSIHVRENVTQITGNEENVNPLIIFFSSYLFTFFS